MCDCSKTNIFHIFAQVTSGQQGTVMPEAGSIVTCRVLSVNPSQATVSIICVGPNKLHTPVSGTVRKQNVRDHQIDTVRSSLA